MSAHPLTPEPPHDGATGTPGTSFAGHRVALVHDWLTGMRGGEKVLEAIAALCPGAPIHTLIHVAGSLSPALDAHPIETSFLQRVPGITRYYRHFLPLFPAAIEDFDFGAYDLIISTSHCVAKGAIPGPHARHLCYCHSPMRYAWDQEQTYFPKRRGPVARLRNLALTALRAWDVASVPRVDLFVANSTFVARRIERYYGRRAEVVPPPVDNRFYSPPPTDEAASNDDYALVVSALAPYKRVEIAIAACRRLGLELRIVGGGPEERRLRALAGPETRFLGRLGPEALRDLYRGARCFLQPGIEDFGIASVEALACGTPVVAVGRGGILDIATDGEHGTLYPPATADSLADPTAATDALVAAIDKSARISFNKLKLVRQAEYFSIERFTQRMHDHAHRLLGEPETSP